MTGVRAEAAARNQLTSTENSPSLETISSGGFCNSLGQKRPSARLEISLTEKTVYWGSLVVPGSNIVS